MSFARDIVVGLEKTGTGQAKLAVCRRFVERKPEATGRELIEHLRTEKVSEVTIQKAEHLDSGGSLEDLLGKPPPRSEERAALDIGQQIARLAQALEGRQEDRQADAQAQGIGLPRKPPREK